MGGVRGACVGRAYAMDSSHAWLASTRIAMSAILWRITCRAGVPGR